MILSTENTNNIVIILLFISLCGILFGNVLALCPCDIGDSFTKMIVTDIKDYSVTGVYSFDNDLKVCEMRKDYIDSFSVLQILSVCANNKKCSSVIQEYVIIGMTISLCSSITATICMWIMVIVAYYKNR